MGNCWTCIKSTASDDNGPDKSDSVNNNNGTPTSMREEQQVRGQYPDAICRSEVSQLLGDPATDTEERLDKVHNRGNALEHYQETATAASTTVVQHNNVAVVSPLLNQISDNKINCLFEEYRDDEDEDSILATGIEKLCLDLRYKPADFAILVLAWRLDAKQMCCFTKAEFIQGLSKLNADSIEKLRAQLEEEVKRLTGDPDLFKDLYRFTFHFGLEPENGRTLSLDMAISLWRLVFTVHTPVLLDRWLDFLAHNATVNSILKDTWMMFLNFVETCDIYTYNDEEAWPSLLDDFVEYERLHRLSHNENASGAQQQDADSTISTAILAES